MPAPRKIANDAETFVAKIIAAHFRAVDFAKK
jgi:hypothetical protein